MTTATWSFYDPATGDLIGQTFTGPEAAIAANTPTGMQAIRGAHDHLVMRVQNGAVVKRDNPLTHEVRARALVLAKIAELERRGLRAMRELTLTPNSRDSRDALAAVDAQIATLRASLPADDLPVAQRPLVLPTSDAAQAAQPLSIPPPPAAMTQPEIVTTAPRT